MIKEKRAMEAEISQLR